MSKICCPSTISNRALLIIVSSFLFFVLEVLNGQTNLPNQHSPSDLGVDALYEMAVDSVVWIPGKGSGVLIGAQLKLAVTNAHVVGDDTEVAVVFPARNRNGKIIDERSFLHKRYAPIGFA